MSASNAVLLAQSALAGHLTEGVRRIGAGLSVTEQQDHSIALIAAVRDRPARLRSELADRMGTDLPADRSVAISDRMTVVSCGPGEYLAVGTAGYVQTFAQDLQTRLAPLALVTDYSDQLTLLALSGACSGEVMARLCSIDFEASDGAGPFAAVTRVGLLRCYLWRVAPAAPLVMAVQRSCAVSFAEALLRAAESVAMQAD